MDTSHLVDRNRATVDQFFRALRRGDKDGLRTVFEPDAVWNVPQCERTPSPRGAEDIVAHEQAGEGGAAEAIFDPGEKIAAGERIRNLSERCHFDS